MSPHTLRPAVAITISIWLSSGLAQSSPDGLEEIVVIANRVPVPLRQVGASVSVIDREDIEAHGNLALTTILRQTPAIGASSSHLSARCDLLSARCRRSKAGDSWPGPCSK